MLILRIAGRIEHAEFSGGKNVYNIKTPAPDAYSHPSEFRVISQQQIGGVGQVVDLNCSVRGFVKPKQYKDKQTGQQKTFWESTVMLEVLPPGVDYSTGEVTGGKK